MSEEAACVDIQSEHAFFSATLYLPLCLTHQQARKVVLDIQNHRQISCVPVFAVYSFVISSKYNSLKVTA